MTLTGIKKMPNGDNIEICVDWDPRENRVEKIYWAYLNMDSVDTNVLFTEIFLELLDGDKIVDSIDWKELSYADEVPCEQE